VPPVTMAEQTGSIPGETQSEIGRLRAHFPEVSRGRDVLRKAIVFPHAARAALHCPCAHEAVQLKRSTIIFSCFAHVTSQGDHLVTSVWLPMEASLPTARVFSEIEFLDQTGLGTPPTPKQNVSRPLLNQPHRSGHPVCMACTAQRCCRPQKGRWNYAGF
jgi:hypothetical protein